MTSAEQVRTLLNYDAETGIMTWKAARRGLKAGQIAGRTDGSGYVEIKILGVPYKAHRLAWLHVTGSWPADQIDHIDGNKTNNAWDNLRPCTCAENLRNRAPQSNNKIGLKGVCFHKGKQKFRAKIHRDGRAIHLGEFKTAEEAYAAYCAASPSIHGDFGRVS